MYILCVFGIGFEVFQLKSSLITECSDTQIPFGLVLGNLGFVNTESKTTVQAASQPGTK